MSLEQRLSEPHAINNRIDANLHGFQQFIGQYADRTYHDDGRLCRVNSRPHAMPNLIFNPRLNASDMDGCLDAPQDTRAAGYRVAVLEASHLGKGIYRPRGFQAFSRLILCEWHPTPAATPS